MGIPYYIASLLQKNKHIQQRIDSVSVEADVFAIDFNCFIHSYLKSENPIGSIMVALDSCVRMIRAKKVFIAFDGLVPFAKMVQQRYRRFRKPDEDFGFDKHQISPGTPFMKELAKTIRFMFPDILLSDTLEPGEGEHKIFLWLRSLPESERQKIYIYGLDADLVLIAIAQSELGNISLLRETMKRDTKDFDAFSFSVFSIPALKAVLPMDPVKYVDMCILCFGNDFMPNIAMFSLRQDGHARALHYFQKSSLEQAGQDESAVLIKRAKETERRIVSTDGHMIETRVGVQLMDGVLDWEKVVYAFWKTYDWTVAYFKTSVVPDWEWYYPYAEAPLMQTILDFERVKDFKWDHPTPEYTIEDQLAFILPSESLRRAGLTPRHPDELYEEGPDSRTAWMRSYAWETDPWLSIPWKVVTSVCETHPPQIQVLSCE